MIDYYFTLKQAAYDAAQPQSDHDYDLIDKAVDAVWQAWREVR